MLINVNMNDSSKRVSFSPPLQLSEAKCALLSLSTYYSFPNFVDQQITIGTTVYHIPTGLYDLADLDAYLKSFQPDFSIKANRQTLRCMIDSKLDVTIEKRMGDILGYLPGTFKKREGDSIVKIMPINNIHIKVSFVMGSYLDGQPDNTIFSFFPESGPGEKIIIRPIPIYLPLSQQQIPFLDISVTDQNGNLIDFQSENISLTFNIL